MDDTLPPDNMSARSATEIAQRTRELATNLGSAFGRLMTEIVTPLVARVLFVMDQQGLIDLPLKVNGTEVKVTPVSPLSQAPKMEEINNLLQYMQIANNMGPEGQTTINVRNSLRFIEERLGIDQAVLNSPEEQQMIMQQMQQMMMAQQQAQQVDNQEAVAEAMV